MASNPFFHLHSDKFSILPGEREELVNDGIYGKSLAEYLQKHLISKGYVVPFVCCEDWGWWVEIADHPFTFGLCVYGWIKDDGEKLDLCVNVGTEPGLRWSWTRLRKVDTTQAVHKLHTELNELFEEDSDITLLGLTEDFPLQ